MIKETLASETTFFNENIAAVGDNKHLHVPLFFKVELYCDITPRPPSLKIQHMHRCAIGLCQVFGRRLTACLHMHWKFRHENIYSVSFVISGRVENVASVHMYRLY